MHVSPKSSFSDWANIKRMKLLKTPLGMRQISGKNMTYVLQHNRLFKIQYTYKNILHFCSIKKYKKVNNIKHAKHQE